MIATAERLHNLKQAPTESPAVLERTLYAEKRELLRNIIKKFKGIQRSLNEISSFEYGVETHLVADDPWVTWKNSYDEIIADLTMLIKNAELYAEAIELFNGENNPHSHEPSRIYLKSATLWELGELIESVLENKPTGIFIEIMEVLKLYKKMHKDSITPLAHKLAILIQSIRQNGPRLHKAIIINRSIIENTTLMAELKKLAS